MISVGRGKHRLKVWNSGSAPAYDVSAKFEGDPHIIIVDEEKQPYEVLEPKKNYELVLITHGGLACKFKIITEWTNANGDSQSKTQMGDL